VNREKLGDSGSGNTEKGKDAAEVSWWKGLAFEKKDSRGGKKFKKGLLRET